MRRNYWDRSVATGQSIVRSVIHHAGVSAPWLSCVRSPDDGPAIPDTLHYAPSTASGIQRAACEKCWANNLGTPRSVLGHHPFREAQPSLNARCKPGGELTCPLPCPVSSPGKSGPSFPSKTLSGAARGEPFSFLLGFLSPPSRSGTPASEIGYRMPRLRPPPQAPEAAR